MNKKEMTEKLSEIHALAERIEAALVVRDPGTARSFEAFEGLRKQVAAASRSRRIHMSHLVTIATDIDKGATLETISLRVNELLRESGVTLCKDVAVLGAFDFVGEGDEISIESPAWIDILEDGSVLVLRQGIATRRPSINSVRESANESVTFTTDQEVEDK